jgi:hypothetical protein
MNMVLLSLRDFSDSFTPMLVKEMRQGLRTRFFTLALMLFHLVLITLMLGMAWSENLDDAHEMFRAVVGLTLLVFLPLRGFDALLRESRGGTLDMLRLAGVSSFRLVYGKWAALFSQTLLFVCSIMPYMIARYQFGGVEIVPECLALILVVIGSAIITAAYVAYSSVSSIWTRLIAGGVSSLAVWIVAVYCMQITSSYGAPRVMNKLANLKVWQIEILILGLLVLVSYWVFVFISLGASRIPDSGENHSTRKRMVALLMHTFLTVIGIVLVLVSKRGNYDWVFMPALLLTITTAMDVMTEAMPSQCSVVRPFLGQSGWKSQFGRLLYPGWVSGVWFSLLLVVMSLSIYGVVILKEGFMARNNDECFWLALAVLSLPFVPVSFSVRYDNRFARWWNSQALLVLMGGMIVIVVEAVRLRDFAWGGIVTPLTSLFAASVANNSDKVLQWAGVSGLCWMVLAAFISTREMRQYRVLETQARKDLSHAKNS